MIESLIFFFFSRSSVNMLHIPSMLTYGLLSFSMAFLNKALFETANFLSPFFVILFQLIFVVLSFHLLKLFRLGTVPSITQQEISIFLIPSLFYCASTVLSLQALMKLNVAIYVVIKVKKKKNSNSTSIDFSRFVQRCTPSLTFFLSTIVLKKQKLNYKLGVCVFTITIGAVITSYEDLSFHPESYIIGSLSVVFHALYLLTIQRASEQKTPGEVLYINSLLSLPMIFIVLFCFTDEITIVTEYTGYNTFPFWLFFLSSTLGGGLLNGATFWCTMYNSALTTRFT